MADIRLLLGILFMFGGVAAVKCPKGIRAFATFADDEYYECAEGKEAVLKKCNAGMKFNKKLAECANPDDLEKRGLKESSESGSHERVSMGEAIKIGALYDVRRGFLYNGFNLWSKKTLKEEIYSVESDGLNVEFLVEKNARDKAKHFGLGAQLELDFLAGLISIKGSAQFLKDYRKTTNSVRMILKGELIGSTEDIDTYTPIDYPDLCEMVTPTSGPTHVITRITKGQRSYFIFDKYVEHNRYSEDIEAELAASVSFIPLCSIEGRIAIHANGTQVKNIDRLNVRFYGDALLASFPTQYPQAAVAYDDTIRNGPRTTPMRYHVTPISEFCDSLADADNVIIHKMTEDLVELSSNSLSVLRGIQASVNTLLELDPAIRYESIKLPLITFKNALEEFMSEYRRQLVDILPKVKAKLINESALVEILVTFENSAFTNHRADTFLTLRKKEIETITLIIDKALKDPKMSLSDVKNAVDNECIFKGESSSAFVLKLLPSEDITQQFLNSRGTWSEEQAWFSNNILKVKEIGNRKRVFESYVNTNKKDAERSQCFLIRLENISDDPDDISEVQLYETGSQFETDFRPPQAPPTPKCPIDEIGSNSMKIVSRRTDNAQVTGQEVLLEEVTAGGELAKSSVFVPNEDSFVVEGLKPFTQFLIKTRYVVHDGHSYSDVTESLNDCVTKPTSPPTALKVTGTTATSTILLWSKPEHIHPAFAKTPIKYRVKVYKDSIVVTDQETSELTSSVQGLQPGTLYSVTVTAEVLDDKTAGKISLNAKADFATAPAALAAPVPGQIQDNRVRFQVKVGDVSVPAGVTKELLSIKYYKINNNQVVSGTEVYYMQRLQNQENTEIDIASLETGTLYGVQVKLLVRYDGRLLGSDYSSQVTVTTTNTGSPIDNLRDNINQFESSSKQKLDNADLQKNQLVSTMNAAENKFTSAKSGGLSQIDDMGERISLDFVGVQQKSNVLQKSKCFLDGFQIWDQSDSLLNTLYVNSEADCLAKCADTDGCSSASVENIKNGNRITSRKCLLGPKRNGYMLYPQKNFISANMYCQLTESATIDTWKECVQENINYPGADIVNSAGISNIEECAAFCQTVEGCVAASFNKPSKTCYAKNKRNGDRVNSDSNTVSVSLMCLSANRGGISRCAKSGVRFTGSVIHTTSTASLDLCIQFCANKDNCESVSYNSSSRSCEAHNKRLGASRGNVGGWTSVNIYCLGLQHF